MFYAVAASPLLQTAKRVSALLTLWNFLKNQNEILDQSRKENSKYWSFSQARKHAEALKFEDIKTFLEWLRSDERPLKFPPNPHEVYPEWTSAREFLGLSFSYKEAKEYLHSFSVKLETEDQFKQWALSDERPTKFPPNPQTFYKSQWEGWDIFLGVSGE